MNRALLKALSLPGVVLAAALLLNFSWSFLGLPSDETMMSHARFYFEHYGLITVFVSAFLEGTLFVGVYYPGSLVIFLGVIFSIGNIPRAIETVLIVTVALILSYCFNFGLGKYGWYRLLVAFGLRQALEDAQQRVVRYGARALFLTYWHPNLAALTATAAGILHMPFTAFAFYSLLSTLFWDTLWGSVVYNLGKASLIFMGLPFIIFFVSVWIVIVLVKTLRTWRVTKP